MARPPGHTPPKDLTLSTAEFIRRRKLWPVSEAAALLGMHRTTLYRLAADGDIRMVRVGGRTFVTDAELDRFVARIEAVS